MYQIAASYLGCYPTGDDYSFLGNEVTNDMVQAFVNDHSGTKQSNVGSIVFLKSSLYMSIEMCNDFCTANNFAYASVDTGLVFRI